MQLLLLHIFALAFQRCLAIDPPRSWKGAGIIISIGSPLLGYYVWPKQYETATLPSNYDSMVRALHNMPLSTSTRTEQATCTISTTSPTSTHTESAMCTTSTPSTHAEQATCRASTDLRQLRCTKDGQNDTVAATRWSEAATNVNYTADATGSTPLLYPSRTHSANTTTLVSSQVFDQRSIWVPLSRNQGILPTGSNSITQRISLLGLAPASFFGSSLAIILLATYQLLIYASPFHDWLYSEASFILAKFVCVLVHTAASLPPAYADASFRTLNSLVQLSCRLQKYKLFDSGHNKAVTPETVGAVYRELRKLDSARYRQNLEAKRLRNLRRKRCVNAKLTYKRAAQDFKECHDHWHAVLDRGITDIRQKLSDFTQLERCLKNTSATCTEAYDSLASHMTTLSDLVAELDSQTALLNVALPKSAGSLQDMKSLIHEIKKFLVKSESADSKVQEAERIIKTLYNVGKRMQMAPFTETLKSIAIASAEVQKVIYEAESAIVAAKCAQRHPAEVFESAIIATTVAQHSHSLPLQSIAPIFDIKAQDGVSTSQYPASPAVAAGGPTLGAEALPFVPPVSTPYCPASPVLALASSTLDSADHPPPSTLAPQRPSAPSFPSPPCPSSRPPQTPQCPLTQAHEQASTELAAVLPPVQPLLDLQLACPPGEQFAPLQTVPPLPSPSLVPGSAELPAMEIKTPCPTSPLATAFCKLSLSTEENFVPLSASVEPEKGNMVDAQPHLPLSPSTARVPDEVQVSAPRELSNEKLTEAGAMSAALPRVAPAADVVQSPAPPGRTEENIANIPLTRTTRPSITPTADVVQSPTPKPTEENMADHPAAGVVQSPTPPDRTEENMAGAPPASAALPGEMSVDDAVLPPAPPNPVEQDMDDVPPTPSRPPLETIAEGVILPLYLPELTDQNMNEALVPCAGAGAETVMEDIVPPPSLPELTEQNVNNVPSPPSAAFATTNAETLMEDAALCLVPNATDQSMDEVLSVYQPPSETTMENVIRPTILPKPTDQNMEEAPHAPTLPSPDQRPKIKPVSQIERFATLTSTSASVPMFQISANYGHSAYDPSDYYGYSAYNAQSAYPDPCDYYGYSAYNAESPCPDLHRYKGEYVGNKNDDETYGPSNVVYPVGTEEVLGPGDGQPVNLNSRDSHSFALTGVFSSPNRPPESESISPRYDKYYIDPSMADEGNWIGDDAELPEPLMAPGDVAGLLAATRTDSAHVDELLLAERAGDDGDYSDEYGYYSDPYGSDPYDSDYDRYGSDDQDDYARGAYDSDDDSSASDDEKYYSADEE